MIALVRALGMKVTAEGIETTEQQRFLKAAGCHYLQGYLSRGLSGRPDRRHAHSAPVAPAPRWAEEANGGAFLQTLAMAGTGVERTFAGVSSPLGGEGGETGGARAGEADRAGNDSRVPDIRCADDRPPASGERLSWRSSDFGAPWLSVPQDCVEDRQQLSGDGDEGEPFGFSCRHQLVAESWGPGCVARRPWRRQTAGRLRTVLRPPPMKLLPFHWPDCRVHGASPRALRSDGGRAFRVPAFRRSACGR